MPKRWRIVSPSGTTGLGIASGGGTARGQSRKFKIEICLDRGKCMTLPWEWDSRQEARQAIEGSDGWKRADVED